MPSLRERIAALERAAAELAERGAPSAIDKFSHYAGREHELCLDCFLGANGKPKRYWAAQEAFFRAVIARRFVAWRSAHKAGKTEVLADLIIAFEQTAPTITVSTAAGARQVETGLWSRIGAQFRRSRVQLVGECLTMQLKVAPDWHAIGFSTNNPTSFQGSHAGIEFPDDEPAQPGAVVEAIERAAFEARKKSNVKRLLFVFDEAPGIDQGIFEAAKGSMMGANTYVVMAGNPTQEYEEDHEFARAHHPGSGYWRIKTTADDADEDPDPVDADESFTIPSFMVARSDIDSLWPKGNPMRNPRAFGRFMDGDVSGRCIPFSFLVAAQEPSETNLKRGAHVGFDTAAEGGDANVAALYVDSVKVSVDQWYSDDTISTWERMKRLREHWAAALKVEIPWCNVHIDDAPIAKGIIDVARREGCTLDAVEFGGEPLYSYRSITGEVTYLNRRAEMFWSLRELLRTGRACIPRKYAQSWRELACANYRHDDKGRLVIEPKKDIKARLGKSPDHADADLLAFCAAPRVGVRRVG